MASSTLEEAKLPGGYLVTPRVPQGLAAAVEGLTREVIRNSPEDIYVFAAHHFEKLLELREECGRADEGGGKSRNMENRTNNTLMEMSRALRMREIDREHARATRNAIDQVGWSLNQTAKVLKRHRSIFGDEGRRITTDEVFLMADQKKNDSQSLESSNKRMAGKKSSGREKSGRNDSWKASTSRTERSLSNEDSTENVTRPGPKIITQMSNLSSGSTMLAKDIKTELRKNRISSRERRNLRARHEEINAQEKSEDKVLKYSGRSSSKKLSEKQKRLEAEGEEKRSRESSEPPPRASKDRRREKSRGEDSSRKTDDEKLTKRAPSMDRVRDFVLDRFATTRSLEELQSVNYVEKVQEIIDETGPIIKEKVEQLKSGVIGRSERSSWFANTRGNRVRGSNDESPSEKFRLKEDSPEISASENSTSDALRARLTETKNLMENVSSSFARAPRRSRSARSFRRSIKNAELSGDHSISRDSLTETADNQGNILERRLSRTRDLMDNISASLSKPMRRSSSAKNLRKRQETVEDEEANKDVLKKRLDETRNLLRGISLSFGKSIEQARNKTTIDPQDSTFSEDQTSSKSSLPAVRPISTRNSSGTVSRSDSDNLVLPAISPEAPRSAKVKEDLVLPVLSPTGTASTNQDSSKILDTNDHVPPADFAISEVPVEDYVLELPAETLSRDSLNATPNFDSIPQRPDSLEPANDLEDALEQREKKTTTDVFYNENSVIRDLQTPSEIIGDLETKNFDEKDVENKIELLDDAENEASNVIDELGVENLDEHEPETEFESPRGLEIKASEAEDLRTESSAVLELSTALSDACEHEESDVAPADLESRLQDIERVQKSIEQVLEPKTTVSQEKIERFDMVEKLRELEEAEKRIDKIFDKENRAAIEDPRDGDKMPVETVEDSQKSEGKVPEEINTETTKSEFTEIEEGEKESKLDVERSEKLSDSLGITYSPEPLNYTYVLTEGSPYEIPDTVTTVIIPERLVESPLSEKLRVEIGDEAEVELSLIPGGESRAESIEEIAENEANSIEADRVKEEMKEKRQAGREFLTEDPEENVETGEKTETKKVREVVDDEDEPSPKSRSDPFGEFVRPETLTETSSDIEFIRGIEDLQIPRQDLGPINEEVSEEMEELTEKQDAMETLRNVEKLEEEREETLEFGEIEKPEGKEGQKDLGESRIVESDLSPEATRPNLNSESSNEVKESSVADEPLESTKGDNSIDDEASSATRTPESSNEIKETTLTDALSLSLDATRPFVPELNLDSLQDITVSSFKMTEDDYEVQERGENESTNSIADTLTSDDNNRTNGGFVEEPVLDEYLVSPSSTTKSDENAANEKEQVVEETIVKSQLEIEEDVCEKAHAYVTGPCETGDDSSTGEKMLLGMEEKENEKEAERVEESESTESLAAPLKTESENVTKVTKEDILTTESGDGRIEEDTEDQGFVDIERNEEMGKEQANEHERTSNVEKEDKSLSDEETTRSEKFIENVEISEQLQEAETELTKIDETLQSQGLDEDVSIESVHSRKEDGNAESPTRIEEEPDVRKADESVDRSNEKEVDNIKSETADTEPRESIDAPEVEKIDGPKLDEIETEEAGDIDMPETEEIDTSKMEEINAENNEFINDGAFSPQASDDSEREEIDLKNTEEIDIVKKEEIASENLNGADDKDLPKKEETTANKEEIYTESMEETGVGKREETSAPETEGTSAEKEEEEEKEAIVDPESPKKGVSEHCEVQSVESPKKTESPENVEAGAGEGEETDVSYGEEETPLAVSRSASQCTTRRVSSGNLAKLREDPALSWTEETEREKDKSESDPGSSKVTFSGIDDEATNIKAVKENYEIVVSPKGVKQEIDEARTTKDSSKECHVYVPEVDASEDYSTSESSTFDSAVTKIQAGVRGFLTRRRLLRGQQNRSSTLSGIPSIQDSIAIDEPDSVDDRVLEASEEKITRPEETSTFAPPALDNDFVDAATKIQSNYRGYKARQRLRREDAVQRTTFSLEKSFAESGLRHTGEFYDCIPLPIHDITLERKASKSLGNLIGTEKSDVSASGESEKMNDDKSTSPPLKSDDIATESSGPLDPAKVFFGGTPIAPLIQFNVRPSGSQLVDLVVLAKEDAALQTGYLNFITSVEDAEAIVVPGEVPLAPTNFTVDQPNSNESLKEPLALSDPPIGLIIEEITSSIDDNAEKLDEENDETMPSTIPSSIAPEVLEESLNSSTALNLSAKVVSGSMNNAHQSDGDTSDRSEVEEHRSGNEAATKNENLTESGREMKMEKSIEHEKESSIMNFPVFHSPMGRSSTKDEEFLGPESSVDSMECPDVQARTSVAPGSPEPMIGESASTVRGPGDPEAKETSPERGSSDRSGISEKRDKEESLDSNVEDSLPSKLSFSMKVEDLLDVGSEDGIDLLGKKPFREVSSKPTDLRKSMSLSQESQLADERIESPITMIQIAPGSSESPKQEELSENAEEENKTNEKSVSSPNSERSDKK
ncbi:titin homolog [Venturia canescens]|uniref:titin homolog n=1 Tax=Venturia canescens TaxID=32260 RepID=UPI001C9D6108|nr:titin homolog [Venturia canescens]